MPMEAINHAEAELIKSSMNLFLNEENPFVVIRATKTAKGYDPSQLLEPSAHRPSRSRTAGGSSSLNPDQNEMRFGEHVSFIGSFEMSDEHSPESTVSHMNTNGSSKPRISSTSTSPESSDSLDTQGIVLGRKPRRHTEALWFKDESSKSRRHATDSVVSDERSKSKSEATQSYTIEEMSKYWNRAREFTLPKEPPKPKRFLNLAPPPKPVTESSPTSPEATEEMTIDGPSNSTTTEKVAAEITPSELEANPVKEDESTEDEPRTLNRFGRVRTLWKSLFAFSEK